MCGRYYIDDSILDSVERLVQKTYRDKPYWTARDVHPTDTAPVISAAANGLAVVMQRWGYPGRQKGTTVFNARAESVTDRRMFENGIRRHRAVIPCTRFYEWNREKEKAEFSRTDSPVLYLAAFTTVRGRRPLYYPDDGRECFNGRHTRPHAADSGRSGSTGMGDR
jgi:putative SOS response-associated peptidase YedK